MGKIVRRRLVAAAAALLAVIMLSPAAIANEGTIAVEAKFVYDSVATSPEPQAKFGSLSPEEKSLFEIWITPTSSHITTTQSSVSTISALDDCRTYTTRGSFSNQVGSTLGEFWTTGQACTDGSSIVTADYIDGGGRTDAFGWGYVGSDAGQGVSDGAGFVYGSHHFRLTIAGVDVQQPSYCARSVFTLAASHGDDRCGIA
ncbi:hypothetical protein [Rathayibacter rathayi]|uniref:hypothetical protein n=1 Tax=Rathayibacter rathayi TaxID=33887 RepID=UPI00119E6CEC|nr:hypothetical protein [Rathayibacter rathayi]MWV74469.1 hypothetical protein [Rathayibacter rathayi NCPPB 2980 = VKM Ac-1601]